MLKVIESLSMLVENYARTVARWGSLEIQKIAISLVGVEASLLWIEGRKGVEEEEVIIGRRGGHHGRQLFQGVLL